jgi:hypothetical protein
VVGRIDSGVAPDENDEMTLVSFTGASFLFGASSEHAVLFWLQKGCAFFYPVIHNFRL